MIKLSLDNKMSSVPDGSKTVMWQFVREDISSVEFERRVCDSDELRQAIGDDSYLALVMADYNERAEFEDIKKSLYEFLVQFPDQCLCNTFPNNTLLYPFKDHDNERVTLLKQIELLKPTTRILDFSGKPPIHQSRWYHPGEISCCSVCKTSWFVIFEASEGSDYYLVRLCKDNVRLISQTPSWPNERWPLDLKDWGSFMHINFKSWNSLYVRKHKGWVATNFLMNYELNVSKYR